MSATLKRSRPVTASEAREIAERYNRSHFRGHGAGDGEYARYSIPVDAERDDDLGLEKFIEQYEVMEVALRTIARASCRCDRGYPGSCGCGERGRELSAEALEVVGSPCLTCNGTGRQTIRVRGGDIDERACPSCQARAVTA
jgi:hypothetical protein